MNLIFKTLIWPSVLQKNYEKRHILIPICWLWDINSSNIYAGLQRWEAHLYKLCTF